MSQPEHTAQSEPIVKADGNPFATETAAKSHLTKQRLSESEYEVEAFGNGFAIMPKSGAEVQEDAPISEPIPKVEPEAYWWVRFQPKTSPMDPDEVHLGCNGEVIQIMRDRDVCLPDRFLEVADHTKYKHFMQDPGKQRKVDYEVHRYPYTKLRKGTRAEFVNQKRKGTMTNQRNAEQQERLEDNPLEAMESMD